MHATLDELRSAELELKNAGRWSETDPHDFTAASLHAIHQTLYGPEDFEGYHEIDELARIRVAPNASRWCADRTWEFTSSRST